MRSRWWPSQCRSVYRPPGSRSHHCRYPLGRRQVRGRTLHGGLASRCDRPCHGSREHLPWTSVSLELSIVLAVVLRGRRRDPRAAPLARCRSDGTKRDVPRRPEQSESSSDPARHRAALGGPRTRRSSPRPRRPVSADAVVRTGTSTGDSAVQARPEPHTAEVRLHPQTCAGSGPAASVAGPTARSGVEWLSGGAFDGVGDLEHAQRVLAQELRPHVVAERHVRHVA